MKKKVLITGGTGGIGKAIVREFLNNHSKVYVLDKDPINLKQLEKKYIITGWISFNDK